MMFLYIDKTQNLELDPVPMLCCDVTWCRIA